jgi:hypothetical protein
MPTHPWPLWTLTGIVLIGFPAINFIYWPEVLRSGVLPTDGDSIGIEVLGSILVTLFLSPFAVGITWLCLRRYNPDARLWSWRRDRLFRSAAATALFGAGAALMNCCCR